MSDQRAARTAGLTKGLVLALLSIVALACTSSAATTAPVASPSPSAGLGPITSPEPSAAPGGQASHVPDSAQPSSAAPSGEPRLLGNLCDMLDPSTINTITSLGVPPGEPLNGSGGTGLEATGHCIWGTPSDGMGVEISSFNEAPIQAFMAASLPGMQAISGVGVAAKGSVATVGAIHHASLYVDFGTFGMLVLTASAKATLDMSVALAKALK